MSDWEPKQAHLYELVELFALGQSEDTSVQRQLVMRLHEYSQAVDFHMYLIFIFTRIEDNAMAQQAAGHVLKNQVLNHFVDLPIGVAEYLKAELPALLTHADRAVATIVSTIMSAVLRAGGVQAWPSLLEHLVNQLDSDDPKSVLGALRALRIICEDCADQLNREELGRPINAIVPRLLPFMAAEHPRMRSLALACINLVIIDAPVALLDNMEQFLQSLFQLASDESSKVRLLVCESFGRLAQLNIDALLPHMEGIIEYIIHASQDDDDRVGLAATQFWGVVTEAPIIAAQMLPEFLPRIVPVLLRNMRYSDFELATLLNQVKDSALVPDDPRDIAPRFIRPKQRFSGDDGDDDDEDDGGGAEVVQWTLRMSSARSLDRIALRVPAALMTLLIPLLHERLADDDWVVMEAAILAIGAVATGCFMHMTDYLPELVPFLLECCAHEQPLVKNMAAWSLSKYSHWIVRQRDQKTFFEPTLDAFLKLCLDDHKKVQESGMSALATFEESAKFDLIPYIVPICTVLIQAFQTYQARNLLICYDAISTLADQLGRELVDEEVINILLPPLSEKWSALEDDDIELLSMFECLTSLCLALGGNLGDFAQPLLARAQQLAATIAIDIKTFEEHKLEYDQKGLPIELDEPSTEPLVCSLDLISGVVEGLGQSACNMINDELVPLLVLCIELPLLDIRTSAFALFGDLCMVVPEKLEPVLEKLVPVLLQNIRPDFFGLCNNALWTLGELAMLLEDQFAQVVTELAERIFPIFANEFTHPGVLHNAVVCYGRMAIHHAEILAPTLRQVIRPFATCLRHMSNNSEKRSAFLGFCELIEANPKDAVDDLVFIADAIAGYGARPDALAEKFRSILHAFKDMLGADWNATYASWPEDLRNRLEPEYFL